MSVVENARAQLLSNAERPRSLFKAAWLDRAAVAAATLLAGDAWFDVVTAHGALALATTESVAIELPVAVLCLWVAQRLAAPDRRDHHTTATPNPKGALQ